jgi:hypothetical protein
VDVTNESAREQILFLPRRLTRLRTFATDSHTGSQPGCKTVREAQVTELLQRIMHISFRAIIIIYKSWRRLATG